MTVGGGYTPPMRPGGVALALFVALFPGCGDDGAPRGSCAATLQWNGDTYFGTGGEFTAPVEPLGEAIDPGCGKQETVGVTRVPGVSPQLAIMRVGGVPAALYLNAGFFLMLESHPLHRRMLGDGQVPRLRSCDGRRTVEGTVVDTPFNDSVRIRAGRDETAVLVRPRTRIEGFRRAGHPYLRRGDLVRARVRRCEYRDEGPRLFATHIEPSR